MKIYLASSFELKKYVQQISDHLEDKGHIITVKWWELDFKECFSDNDKEWYAHPKIKEIRDRNFKGIDDADLLILVSEPLKPRKFNGANVELGYAIAKGKKVCHWGDLERSAMYQGVDEIVFNLEVELDSDYFKDME